MEQKGILYLLPTPLSDGAPGEVIPAGVLERIGRLQRFVVENERTARRFLSRAGLKGHIEALELHELSEHSSPQEIAALLHLFEGGCDVGLMSEAGLPAVADPGAALVALCHAQGIRVVPAAGPSSLMMALMASGLDGQHFGFNGYLPAKTEQRRHALKELEKRASGCTQLFIETPYRSDALLADILSCCRGTTRLCLAVNLTAADETVRTLSVEAWKKEHFTIGKRPCVFLILA